MNENGRLVITTGGVVNPENASVFSFFSIFFSIASVEFGYVQLKRGVLFCL